MALDVDHLLQGHVLGGKPGKGRQTLEDAGADHQEECEQEEFFPADPDKPACIGMKALGDRCESLGPADHEMCL